MIRILFVLACLLLLGIDADACPRRSKVKQVTRIRGAAVATAPARLALQPAAAVVVARPRLLLPRTVERTKIVQR